VTVTMTAAHGSNFNLTQHGTLKQRQHMYQPTMTLVMHAHH